MKKNNFKLSKSVLMLFLFLAVPLITFAQSISVTGTVTDSNGESLPGVSIVVTGTTIGTTTNIAGNYSIEVTSDAQLTFSFIGFSNQLVAVDGRTTVNIVLTEDTETIEEVVVIGYGTQRKEAVTGSVASIRGEMMREVPSTDVSKALQGRVAGVQFSQTSSKPGADMQIRIRGTRSLNASNDPLIVLDNIPYFGDITDINPSDIKSIDILKDASSTAIYGSRGANGVILITTNKGSKGQKARVNYNGYQGYKTVFSDYPMMNGAQLTALREVAGMYSNGEDEVEGVDTDWQDLLYRTGKVTSHDITVSGGSERGNYSFGLGYNKDEAVIPLQDYERLSLRASVDQEIGKYVKVGFSSYSTFSLTNGNSLGLYSTLSTSPLISPYDDEGNLRRTGKMELDEYWLYTKKSLKALGDKYADETKEFGTYNNIYAEVKIPKVEGLKYRINVGLNYRSAIGGYYEGQGVFDSDESTVSKGSLSKSYKTQWTVENILTYDKTFADKHRVNVVALYSAEESHYDRSKVSGTNIPADYFQYYNLAYADEITVDPDEQWYEESGLNSIMGRAMYSYDDRYMLSVAFRSDGSSRLAEGEKWHSYPAMSAGWNIKEESFMESVDIINQLKLRVGYGQTSNQSVDPYKTLGSLETVPYNFGDDDYVTGLSVSELPNSEMGWEYSETWNFGLDFSLLDRRLSGSFEYYIQNTEDVLLEVSLPSTSGVDSYWANIGKTENKGFELSLNGVILENRNGWTVEAGVNLYANKNKLVALASGQTVDVGNWWFVGHPIDVIYDYEKIGIWQEDDANIDILEPGGNAGMIKVKYTGEYDESGVPTRAIGADDKQVHELEPDFMGGFNARVAYKDFDLSIVGAFQKGGTLISTLHSSSGYLNLLTGRRNNVDVDYWTPDNTGGKYPLPGGIQSGDNPKYGSTLGYFDASYLKIRNITVGYNLDNLQWIKDIGINKLRVYASVQNPFVFFSPFERESGLDPETNSYGDENQAINETYKERLLTVSANSPSTRNFLFGFNLSF
jgi:TonB-linked SusC/RagA family outer membrane protein